ncbi:ABC transporter permease [Phycisphaerales bacterium AB-hyl4]|uniref:ABC transporter permease n=1 Tax=Natronomicrosphaera hydrolytica TaxID=3242702 RepID=A0ABV4U9G0_9BACT
MADISADSESEIRHPKFRAARPPWYLVTPVVICAAGVALPLVYLGVRALDADAAGLREVLLRWRNLALLGNTLLLTLGVLLATVAMALPAAWLTVRTDLPGRRFFTLALVLPLAIPGYLMAYALLAVGGQYGAAAQLLGVELPRLSGYWGALVALSFYNFPYMLLNLRAALNGLDPGMEEVAQSLGHRPMSVFFRVIVPQLRPALVAGGLIVALHVLGDFAVVSLLGYETFSYALYLEYKTSAYVTSYAAWLALMMLTLAGMYVAIELGVLRGLRLHRAGAGMARRRRMARLGGWRWPAAGGLVLLLLAAVGVPVTTISYWATQANYTFLQHDLWDAVMDSLWAATPAAVLATLLAMPVAYLARRYPGKRSTGLERLSYLGYATPSLAFAMGLLVVGLYLLPDAAYQWLYHLPTPAYGLEMLGVGLSEAWYDRLDRALPLVLIYALGLHFLAEAVGPIRSSLYQATPRLEEASRSLGHGQIATFFRVTLPLLRPGLVVSLALVFLSVMKELPLTFLLSPLGFGTLATNLWSYTEEAMFAEAAPFALLILLLAAMFVGVLLANEGRKN